MTLPEFCPTVLDWIEFFMEHCVAKIREIILLDAPDRRALMQLGYNLGRLSELTGLGRGPFWDLWKDAVAVWDQSELRRLAQILPD